MSRFTNVLLAYNLFCLVSISNFPWTDYFIDTIISSVRNLCLITFELFSFVLRLKIMSVKFCFSTPICVHYYISVCTVRMNVYGICILYSSVISCFVKLTEFLCEKLVLLTFSSFIYHLLPATFPKLSIAVFFFVLHWQVIKWERLECSHIQSNTIIEDNSKTIGQI